VKVDFVLFPDGLRADVIPRYLRKANAMYNRVGISVSLGVTVLQHEAGTAACDIFEKNRHADHDHDFMYRPEPKSLRISPAVGKRMRDTALNVLT
jgi:hypothetical protein